MGDIVQFPKVVKIAQLFNEGLFGISVDNVVEVKVYESSILIWFNTGSENNRVWDLSLEYANNKEAEASYNDMLNAIREIRFKEKNRGDK